MTLLDTKALTRASLTAIAASMSAPLPAQSGPFDRVIVFGDSISDSGVYADKAPEGAGRFTTNPDPVWVEHIANGYGLSLSSSAAGGLNFAEGGARVSTPRDGAPGDLTRTPITEQVAGFLGRQSFAAEDLVIIQGGGNDVFATQTNGLDFTPADLKVLEAAANDLAGLLGEVEAAGAQWLVTTSVPQFEPFNAYYREALAAEGVNLLYFDAAALIEEIKADPSTYGLVNITDPACRGTAVQSFRCLPEDLVTPDANETYLFADRVHFTGIIHQIQAQATMATVNSLHQLDAAVRLIDAAQPSPAAWLTPPAQQGTGIVGSVRAGRIDIDDNFLEPRADVTGLSVGLARNSGRHTAGFGLSYGEGEGNVGPGTGLDWQSLGLQAFYEHRAGSNRLRVDGGWSTLRDVRLSRSFALGPATRDEQGETDGQAVSAAVTLSRQFTSAGFLVEPLLSLSWRKLHLDGWTEADGQSTSISVEDLDEETLEAGIGVRAEPIGPARWAPFGSAALYRTVAGSPATVTITSAGAPVPFTAPEFDRSRHRAELEAGIKGQIGANGRLVAAGRWSPLGDARSAEFRLTFGQAF